MKGSGKEIYLYPQNHSHEGHMPHPDKEAKAADEDECPPCSHQKGLPFACLIWSHFFSELQIAAEDSERRQINLQQYFTIQKLDYDPHLLMIKAWMSATHFILQEAEAEDVTFNGGVLFM